MKPVMISLLCATLLLTGCALFQPNKPEQPPRLDLNRRLLLVDEQGQPVGNVLLRPLGNGEMRDANGELIGIIMRPQ